MAGPTADYGYTSFGSDVATPGYVSENPVPTMQCSPDGTCSFTFKHSIPATATGTYSIGIEGRRGLVINAGKTNQVTTEYGGINKVINFSVDGSPITPRRTVVSINNCNGCHTMNAQTEYVPTGNPYLLRPPAGPFSGTRQVNPATYLGGGSDFGPFPGLAHLYSRNLTPDKTGRPAGGSSCSAHRPTIVLRSARGRRQTRGNHEEEEQEAEDQGTTGNAGHAGSEACLVTQ